MTGELVAVDLRGSRAGGIVAPLLDFRLDPAKRRRATEAASARPAASRRRSSGSSAPRLKPGDALVAMLVEHAWARSLEDAVSRTGGTPLASEFVEAGSLAELVTSLMAAVAQSGDDAESP